MLFVDLNKWFLKLIKLMLQLLHTVRNYQENVIKRRMWIMSRVLNSRHSKYREDA